MTCSKKNDPVIWDLKGQILATIDTHLGTTHRAKISPCGRFVVVSGNFYEIYKIKTVILY